MQKLLEAGFTTVLSGGGAPEPLIALRNQIDKGEIKATVGQNPYLMGFTAMMLCYGAKYPTSVPFPYGLGPCVSAPVDTGVGILYQEDVQIYKSAPKF